MRLTDLDAEHARERVLQEILATATAVYWNRRAEAMEWAKPRRGDYTGHATTEELREAWRRCDERARACRAAAVVAEWPYDPEAVIADRLEEYARWHDMQRFASAGAVICPDCGTPTSPWTCSCGATRVGEVAA